MSGLMKQLGLQMDCMVAEKLPEKTAKVIKATFSALMKEGFSREEAVQLCAGGSTKTK
jgi:hypothetical protein